MTSGGGDRYRRIKQLRRKLDHDGSYWKHEGKDGTDGVWVSNDPWKARKGNTIDQPDDELRHAWQYPSTDGRHFGGKRPSKRKSVK
jgi:hypothetical protein